MRPRVVDFRLDRTAYDDHGTIFHATITVVTGVLWWKRQEEINIFRAKTDNWRLSDSGEYIRSPQVKNLARVWKMKHGEEC